MGGAAGRRPWTELAVATTGVIALLIAAAAAASFAAPEAWTLVSVLGAGFVMARGLGRLRLPRLRRRSGADGTAAGGPEPTAPTASAAEATPPTASRPARQDSPAPATAARSGGLSAPAPPAPQPGDRAPAVERSASPASADPVSPLLPAAPRTPVPDSPPSPSPVLSATPRSAAHPADHAEHTVVLSEERPEVTKRQRPRERLRVRKQIVTEYVTVQVPVRREELVIEAVPVGEAGVLEGPLPEGGRQEIVLSGEEPVVGTRIVPRERVWLETAVVVQEGTIREEVRRERLEVDSDEGATR